MNYSLQNMLTSLVGSACYLIMYIVIKEVWFHEVVGYEAFIRPMAIPLFILITIAMIWSLQESKEKTLGAVMPGTLLVTLTMLIEGLSIMVVIEFPDMSLLEFLTLAFITTLACIAGLSCIGLVSRIQKRKFFQIFGEIFPAVAVGWIVGALYIF